MFIVTIAFVAPTIRKQPKRKLLQQELKYCHIF
jgi:hypothetical protein